MAGKRKEKVAEFHRANILAAANELFMEKGIAGTTVDDIARKADYSKTTIYAYFASKEELLNHLTHDAMELFRHNVEELAAKGENFTSFYFSLCDCLTRLHDECPLYYQGITGKISCNPACMEESSVLRQIYLTGEDINAIIGAQIKKAMHSGEITLHADVEEIIMLFWFSLSGVIEKANLKAEYLHYQLGKTKQEFLNFSFHMLLHLLQRKQE